jgi:hypothetical protein
VTRHVGTHTELKDGDIVLMFFSKNLIAFFLRGGTVPKSSSGGESRVRRRMSKKWTIESSITSMGFPLLQNPGDIQCVDRQMDTHKVLDHQYSTVENLYTTYIRKSNDVVTVKLSTRQVSPRKKKKSGGSWMFRGMSVLQSEVAESVEFDTVREEIRRLQETLKVSLFADRIE